MIGLTALLAIVAWSVASIAIASWIGRRAKNRRRGLMLTSVMIPVFLVLPLTDELIGKVQFDLLCEQAEEIAIYRTVPVGGELYTREGDWRQDLLTNKRGKTALRELSELSKRLEELLRYEQRAVSEVGAAIPIYEHENRVYWRATGDLLAVYRSYSTPGGWLSRMLEKPAIVRSQCISHQRKGLEKRLLTFNG